MKLIIGGDGAGRPLVDVLREHLRAKGHEVVDDSENPDRPDERYADLSERVARRVLSGEFERGILCCGTGLGVSISANKVPGIRAAVAHDAYSAERATLSNDAQILAMGARVIGPELAKTVADAYLAVRFDPSSHSKANVDAIDALDARARG
jgi:ribose 5-phosphate isomerase B